MDRPARAVVNFAKGSWYPHGQARLGASLARVAWGGAFFPYDDEAVIGARRHAVEPYGFKPAALRHANGRYGADLVLWCDASVWAVGPLDPVFDHIAQHGHLFFYNCLTGPWASDAALAYFDVDRDLAMTIPMLHGLCMGLDLRVPRSREFMRQWLEAVPTFAGSWTNEAGQVSADPRVVGHRHDQTAASIIAWRLRMELVDGPKTFLWLPTRVLGYDQRDQVAPPGCCLYAQGI